MAALTVLLAASGAAFAGAAPPPSVAYFYASPVPVDELAGYDRVVLDPDAATDDEVDRLSDAGAEVYGYLSVGEMSDSRSWAREVDPRWRLGENPAWKSAILDPAQPGWRALLLRRMGNLVEKRYAGVFLDTLDSYEAVLADPAARATRAKALASLITEAHQRYPGLLLLLNRGFAVLDAVAPLVAGVAAESLYAGWDPVAKRYRAVPEEDRRWLLQQLARATALGLPVSVIDYVATDDKQRAQEVAGRIRALGFAAWVSTPGLDAVGVGRAGVGDESGAPSPPAATGAPLPRRVLLVYDSDANEEVAEAAVTRYAAMPLEYLGYAVEYASPDGLPAGPLAGRYAGVVTWFSDDRGGREGYRAWLLARLDEHVPVVIVGQPGFSADAGFLRRLGLSVSVDRLAGTLRVEHADEMLGFESPVSPRMRDLQPWEATRGAAGVTAHLAVTDGGGHRATPIVTGPWGGIALDPYVLDPQPQNHARWILDPFAFFAAALHRPPMPAPDPTTENGLRLLMSHIDGDGFLNLAEMPGREYAARVILERVLQRFRIPTTVSVIEGEVGPSGQYPRLSPVLEDLARQIFRLPHVEMASHTYSHPFDWRKIETSDAPGERLAIPGYRFDLTRDIDGSVRYINARLAPPGKRVKVFLWSGDALPGPLGIARTDGLGLANMNGGDTYITNDKSSMTEVSPIGIRIGAGFQIYAPIGNENMYTNKWTGPFYGYRAAVETFHLTDTPRRLKPMDIYFHFYAGGKVASLTALETVYRYALGQDPFPVYVSEYVGKARGFQSATIARRSDGGWEIGAMGTLRTVRLDRALGYPDLERSRGVAGVRDLPQGRYVHLSGELPVVIYTRAEPPSVPHLAWANGAVVRWRRAGDGAALRLRAHVPLDFAIAGASGRCSLRLGGGRVVEATGKGAEQRFALLQEDTGNAQLSCH